MSDARDPYLGLNNHIRQQAAPTGSTLTGMTCVCRSQCIRISSRRSLLKDAASGRGFL